MEKEELLDKIIEPDDFEFEEFDQDDEEYPDEDFWEVEDDLLEEEPFYRQLNDY